MLRDGRTVSELSESDQPVMVHVTVDATLDYEIPIIDGWELICTFDIMPVPEKNEHVVFTSKKFLTRPFLLNISTKLKFIVIIVVSIVFVTIQFF